MTCEGVELLNPLPQCFLLGSLLHTNPEVFTPKSQKKMETTFIFKEKIFSTESGFSSFGINFIHVLVELVILQPLKRNSSQITQ